ncbi:hypothetical protein Q5E86_18300 [Providencia sp. CRE-138-0111]|uniref:Uncharacterized protein n=1 Tax=Providencia huashanensis TaxID=3037798 RepID=A0ABT9AUE9_9GAMM|nr:MULTISPECIES: hypothetical protein [Providencia]MDO7833328.1 hypothetical protein [Providencia sp. CRE-138-0026]MDO7858254.1 hypothetical protein [Providencia sp. CRE-138-0111]
MLIDANSQKISLVFGLAFLVELVSLVRIQVIPVFLGAKPASIIYGHQPVFDVVHIQPRDQAFLLNDEQRVCGTVLINAFADAVIFQAGDKISPGFRV